MSDWGWIVFGYTVVYGVIIAYALYLANRLRVVRSQRLYSD